MRVYPITLDIRERDLLIAACENLLAGLFDDETHGHQLRAMLARLTDCKPGWLPPLEPSPPITDERSGK